MNKEILKAKLREGLMSQAAGVKPTKQGLPIASLNSMQKTPQALPEFKMPDQEPEDKGEKTSARNLDKDYAEIQTKLTGTILKQSQVMAAAGLGDPKDATDRSLFSKKVRKDKNDEGGQYLFNDKELASVIKVLNNPAAYLSVRKGHHK